MAHSPAKQKFHRTGSSGSLTWKLLASCADGSLSRRQLDDVMNDQVELYEASVCPRPAEKWTLMGDRVNDRNRCAAAVGGQDLSGCLGSTWDHRGWQMSHNPTQPGR